ncbi:MAG: helix-turn-helix transcriptional regulator [Myxococcales bacterium]|nr:helix-turn-helix transcriptional regulator [Myxococcales bacterium]
MRSRFCQTARIVSDFRYAQFCPLARAAEIVGERWTLLILRELLIGPKRFSDLQAPLAGVSSSVLADRLGKLTQRGVVRRRELPPPAAANAAANRP